MRKKTCFLMLAIPVMTFFCTWGYAAIIVESEAVKWEPVYDAPGIELPDIPMRITAEYVTSIHHKALVLPQDLLEATRYVPSRIIVEYATAILHFKPEMSPICDKALWILANSFGSEGCNTGDPCPADFYSDGDVDGSDIAELIDRLEARDCPDFGWPGE